MMKKKQFYGVLLLMAVMAFSLLSCSSSDDNDDLVSPISRSGNIFISGTWMLSGYISDGVYKDMKPFAGFITLEENGHFLCKIGKNYNTLKKTSQKLFSCLPLNWKIFISGAVNICFIYKIFKTLFYNQVVYLVILFLIFRYFSNTYF